MGLRELRSLVMLADTGNMRRVAEKLHLSPAAVHKQMKMLGIELSVPLYEKRGRQLQLTPAAEIVLPYFRDILAQYQAAMAALEQWKGLRKGTIRIGAGPTISSYVLPPLLRLFRRRYPKVDLFIETGHSPELINGVLAGSLDLALLISSELLLEPRLSSEAYWDFEMVIVSHIRSTQHACEIRKLSHYPFILFQKGSRFENLIDTYLARVGFRPKVPMRFDNAEAIKAMIRTGLGMSILPFWAVDGDIRKGHLHLVRQREDRLLGKLTLVSRKTSYVPPQVAAFIDVAKEFECTNPRLTSQQPRRRRRSSARSGV